MNLQQLEELDIRTASIPELESAIRVAGHSLNRRIEHISNTKSVYKGAVNYINRTGGKFAISNPNIKRPQFGATSQQYRASLQKEVARAQGFLAAKGSTVKGARAIFKKLEQNLFDDDDNASRKAFEKLPKSEQDDLISAFWDEYHRFKESTNYKYEESEEPDTNDSGNHSNDPMLKEFRRVYRQGLRGDDLVKHMQDAVQDMRRKQDEESENEWERQFGGSEWSQMFK